MSDKPTKSEITAHFKDAQEIECIATGIKLDIGLQNNIYFKNGSYVIGTGTITLWREGKYAVIIKKKSTKKCQCVSCNCKDKKKLIKRNPKN